MNKTTKAVLTVLGLAAIIVPAILLIVFSGKSQKEPNIESGSRQIDAASVENAANKYPKPTPAIPSSPSAAPSSASSSAK